MKYKLLSLVVILFISPGIKAQTKTLFMSVADSICGNNTVGINIQTKNFTNIVAFQNSVVWDTTVLKYKGIKYGAANVVLNASNINQKDSSIGRFSFLWFDPTTLGVIIPDSTIILTLNFDILNPSISSTSVYFGNYPALQEIDTISSPVLTTDSTFIGTCNDTSFKGCSINILAIPVIIQNDSTLICKAGCSADTTPDAFRWYGASFCNFSSATYIGIGSSINYNNNPYPYYFVTATYGNTQIVSGCMQIAPLPVTLLSFNVKGYKSFNTVRWQTTNEVNTSHFNIQRSTDGSAFITIGSLNAKGASTYTFNDPIMTDDSRFTKLFYRLEIVDKGGSKSYSDVRELTIDNGRLTISPNQARTFVTVTGHNIKNVMLLDFTGRIVISKEVSNTNTINLSVNNLSKGIYLVKAILIDGSIKTEKLLVE